MLQTEVLRKADATVRRMFQIDILLGFSQRGLLIALTKEAGIFWHLPPRLWEMAYFIGLFDCLVVTCMTAFYFGLVS